MLGFSLGQTAGHDIGVDDKLQIALVGPDRMRLLYHPLVNLESLRDYFTYFAKTFGVRAQEQGETDQRFTDINAVLNDLYHAILIGSSSMSVADRTVNRNNTMSKVDSSNRERYEKQRLEALAERDKQKGYVKELVDGWAGGDIAQVVAALNSYRDRRNTRYSKAVEFVKSQQK